MAQRLPHRCSKDPAANSPPAAVAKQHGADSQRQLAHLARKLALTSQQRAAIGAILERRAQQMQQLRADSSMDLRSHRNRLRALKQVSDRQLQAVLSDSQRQQYQQMPQQAVQWRHARQAPDGGGAGRP